MRRRTRLDPFLISSFKACWSFFQFANAASLLTASRHASASGSAFGVATKSPYLALVPSQTLGALIGPHGWRRATSQSRQCGIGHPHPQRLRGHVWEGLRRNATSASANNTVAWKERSVRSSRAFVRPI